MPRKTIVTDQAVQYPGGFQLTEANLHRQIGVLKIVVAGDGGVGKTSLIRRYVSGSFNPSEHMTIGCDFYTKTIDTQAGHQYKFQIWDVGGQEQFRVLLPLWSKGLRGAILAFDVGSIGSYLHLDEWLALMLKDETMKRIPVIVVGNKNDLSDGSIRESDVERYVMKRNLSGYYLVSAKDGTSVASPFQGLLELIVNGENGNGGLVDGKQQASPIELSG
jgi:small GTP-binding protein